MIGILIAFGPNVVAGIGLAGFARYVVLTARRKEAGQSFAIDFIPFTSDVAAAEAEFDKHWEQAARMIAEVPRS